MLIMVIFFNKILLNFTINNLYIKIIKLVYCKFIYQKDFIKLVSEAWKQIISLIGW